MGKGNPKGNPKNFLHRSPCWVKLKDAYPDHFDIVSLAYDDGTTQPMWWTGAVWDGYREPRNSTPVAWKKIVHH